MPVVPTVTTVNIKRYYHSIAYFIPCTSVPASSTTPIDSCPNVCPVPFPVQYHDKYASQNT